MFQKRLLPFCASFSAICLLIFTFSNCNSDDKDKPNTPDVSHISAPLTVHRFDQEVFAIDTTNTEGGVLALEQKYPDFTKLYFERVIGIKDPADSVGKYRSQVRPFLTDVSMRGMMDTIKMVYPNFDDIKSQIENGLRFHKFYFPQKPVPTEIITMPSAYNFSAVLATDSTIAIGLDMFLGENHQTYESLITSYPKFISRTFRKDYLVNRVFELLVSDLAGEPKGNRLLDYMIHNGKKLYIIDCLLPNVPDSIKLTYTASQMSGTYTNEGFTWGRILKQNLLYSTKFQDFQKLVTPSPDAPIIAAEAPGGVGNFLGWQIVKQFMKRNPQTSLTDLINMQDAQKILDLSKYKPPK